MGNHLVINGDGIAHLARAVLEREGDEVPEPAAREGVLVGKSRSYDFTLNWWRRVIVAVIR